MTGRMSWVMRPTLFDMVSPWLARSGSQRFGAGNDLDQFLGDHRLARAVVGERLLADHLAGVARGVVHGARARTLLGRGVLQERAKNLHRKSARQELVEDFIFLGLVFVGRGDAAFLLRLEHRRGNLQRPRGVRPAPFGEGGKKAWSA